MDPAPAIMSVLFKSCHSNMALTVAFHLQVFAGKDASRGLGKSSLKPEDAVSDWSTLTDEEKGVLNDWYTYFSKRYNIVGKVAA